MGITDKIKESFQKGSVTTRLIYINVGLFIILHLLNILFVGGNGNLNMLKYLALPSDFHQFLLKPWTLFTFMFFDSSFMSLLFNAIFLYWIGKIFIFYFDENKLLGVYLLGGISGGIFFMMALLLFPGLHDNMITIRLLGAASPVIAIIAAVAFYAPNYPIQLMLIGKIKIKNIAIIICLIYAFRNNAANACINFAYLGSGLLGSYFAVNYRKGNDITRYFIFFLNKLCRLFDRKHKINFSFRTNKKAEPSDYNKEVDQKEINHILDKVRESGYGSLTSKEKKKLFNIKK